MLWFTLASLLAAVLAGICGFIALTGVVATAAKLLCVIFLLALIGALLAGRYAPI
jgi:uncharacterized membrane protein YtjA (UPF0391 family)